MAITNETLSIHILSVGDADSIVIQLPADNQGKREHIIIDAGNGTKTKQCLESLNAQHLRLVVATHPHIDHIRGLQSIMEDYPGEVEEFWDSGFRINGVTWNNLIEYIYKNKEQIQFIRPTSGMITQIGKIEITVLAPSIYLRNRYDTYGVDQNNASIVLKIEYEDFTIILAGDAEWDSWGKVTEEFPYFKPDENPDSLIQVQSSFNPIKCDVLKVSHHGSKHGTSLQAIERLRPKYAIISCGEIDAGRFSFPDEIAIDILNDDYDNRNTHVITTSDNGSIILHFTPGKAIEIEPDDFVEYASP